VHVRLIRLNRSMLLPLHTAIRVGDAHYAPSTKHPCSISCRPHNGQRHYAPAASRWHSQHRHWLGKQARHRCLLPRPCRLFAHHVALHDREFADVAHNMFYDCRKRPSGSASVLSESESEPIEMSGPESVASEPDDEDVAAAATPKSRRVVKVRVCSVHLARDSILA
jgi:hypothetical protein